MTEQRLISLAELAAYGSVEDLNEQVKALVKQQQKAWQLAGSNYAALLSVQIRKFIFGHFNIEVHYNPQRIKSSAAHTDAASIAARLCFLCSENLPSQQKGISVLNNYIILANPFPIFPVHLTIAHKDHIPQQLKSNIADMLYLTRQLHDFTIFYNGPQCGASAPDHFHFQAVKRGFLPIEAEINRLKEYDGAEVFQKHGLEVIAVEKYLRNCIALISADEEKLLKGFSKLYRLLTIVADIEPMMNVLSFLEKGQWFLIVFPRSRQRPSHFYKEGTEKIIVGPAAVEMSGVLVLPRLEDFNKINLQLVSEIYNEVTINSKAFKIIKERIMEIFQADN